MRENNELKKNGGRFRGYKNYYKRNFKRKNKL